MGLGILAVCAIIPKLVVLRNLGTNKADTSRTAGYVYLFCFLEMCLGIITTCLPPLKTGAEAWLRRMGIISGPGTGVVSADRTARRSKVPDEMEIGGLERQRIQSVASLAAMSMGGTSQNRLIDVPEEGEIDLERGKGQSGVSTARNSQKIDVPYGAV
jgi:hypothetical protein